MHKVFLGIGSNMGNRDFNLREAVASIRENIGTIVKTSSLFETEPWGFETDTSFLNMAVEVETKLTPSGVLGAILMIETKLGRSRGEKQYTSRVIDIDILFYDDLIMDEAALKIPHPLLHNRKFVLVPLNEIATGFIHPVLKKSIGSLLESCEDQGYVWPQDHKTTRQPDNQTKGQLN